MRLKAKVSIETHRKYPAGGGGFASMGADIESLAHESAYNFARSVSAGYRARVHVITGALKASIKTEKVTEGHHKIVVGKEYGVYEEYGTRYRPGHPAFIPALEAAKAEWRKEFQTIFRRAR